MEIRSKFALPTLVSLALLGFATLPARAQTVYSESYPDNYPPPLPKRQGPQPPPIVLEWDGEIRVSGPLRAGPLALRADYVLLPTPDGAIRVELGGENETTRLTGERSGPELDRFRWIVARNGRFRWRTAPEGGLIVEKRRNERAEWKKSWRLSTPAPLSSPPTQVGRRLVYTTSDGRAHAVRLSNGHRLWATDLGERVSAATAVWSGSLSPSDAARGSAGEAYFLLLVVPDSGTALLAIDVYDGRVLARGSIPGGRGRLVSAPLLLTNGRIAVARQGYALEDAALGFFRVRESQEKTSPDVESAVPYNAED